MTGPRSEPARVRREDHPVTNSQASGPPPAGEAGRAEWLRQLATELSAAGLRAHVHDTRSLLDLTAAVPTSGGKGP